MKMFICLFIYVGFSRVSLWMGANQSGLANWYRITITGSWGRLLVNTTTHADKQFEFSDVRGRIVIICSQMFWFHVCTTFNRYMAQKSCGYLWGLYLVGGKYGRRYIPAYDLCSSLSNMTCKILPSMFALTDCDTTSAFFRIGKKSWKHHLNSCLN